MIAISEDDILDFFNDGNCLLVLKQKKFVELNEGCTVHLNGKECVLKNIQTGKNRLLLHIKN